MVIDLSDCWLEHLAIQLFELVIKSRVTDSQKKPNDLDRPERSDSWKAFIRSITDTVFIQREGVFSMNESSSNGMELGVDLRIVELSSEIVVEAVFKRITSPRDLRGRNIVVHLPRCLAAIFIFFDPLDRSGCQRPEGVFDRFSVVGIEADALSESRVTHLMSPLCEKIWVGVF